MGRLDLVDLLGHLESYILIKKADDFPHYHLGTDLDLVVPDRTDAIGAIHAYFSTHFSDGLEMTIHDTAGHCHVDFLEAGKLNIRIDIIDSFDFFSRIAIKPGYIFKLFKDRQVFECGHGQVYVPSDEDELLLRYFEYLEWFDVRPDKIKHLDFICAVQDEALKARFFQNTHRYVQIKRKSWLQAGRRQALYECETGSDAVQMIKMGARYLLGAVVRRVLSVFRRFKSDRYSRIERVEHSQ